MFEPRAECMGRRCETATARATVSGDKAPSGLPLDSSGKAGAEATLVTRVSVLQESQPRVRKPAHRSFRLALRRAGEAKMKTDYRPYQVEKDLPQINQECIANFESDCGFAAPQCRKAMPYRAATLELRGYASNRRGVASPMATIPDDSVRPSLSKLGNGRAAGAYGLQFKRAS